MPARSPTTAVRYYWDGLPTAEPTTLAIPLAKLEFCCKVCERKGKRVVFFSREGESLMFNTRDHQFVLTRSQLLAVCRPCGNVTTYSLALLLDTP